MDVGGNGEKDADANREDCSGHSLMKEGDRRGGQQGGGVHEDSGRIPTKDKMMSVPDTLGWDDLLEKISGSPLSALDKGKEQAEQAANFLKGKGEELGKTLASGSQELTLNLSSTLSSWASLRQPGKDGKTQHADGNNGDGQSIPDTEGETISGDGGVVEGGGRGKGRRGKGGGAKGGKEEGKDVEKPWETVRDALLSWQGPDRVFIDRWRVHLSREGFVTRWLNSSRGDIKTATEKLIKHLRWRCEWRLDEMELEDWSDEDAKGEMYVSGVDRDGRASMCWRLGMFTPNEKSPHKHVRYLVYTMERTWAVSPLADHMNVIVDCKGVGLDTYHHATVSLAVDVLSHNYPDNLEVVFVFPVGWILTSLLSLFTPLLSKETVNKGRMLQEGQVNQGLASCFDQCEIEERLGGTLIPADAVKRRKAEETAEGRAILRSAEEYARSTVMPSSSARALQEALGMKGGGGDATPKRSRISLLGDDEGESADAGGQKGEREVGEKEVEEEEGWTEGQAPGVIGRYLTRHDASSTAEKHSKSDKKVHALSFQGILGSMYGAAVWISAAIWWVVYAKGFGLVKIEAKTAESTRPPTQDL